MQQLVEDARAQDALPLLAFTLRELADRYAGDGIIDLHEYTTGLGGMQAAVAKSAEDLVERAALTPEALDQLRRAFLQLVRITADGTCARQFARWKDVPADTRGLLETFVEARLLTSRGEGLERVVEVAHEAIFKSWARLAGWLKDAAAALQLREQVRDAAGVWDRNGRPVDHLWRGGRLVQARELLENDEVSLEPLELAFVQASIKEDEAARERARIARRNRTVALAVVAVAGIGLSIWAGRSAQKARLAQGTADVAARSAEERAREASIAATRARAAQSFAEFQRVNARLQAAKEGSFEALALEALTPKYGSIAASPGRGGQDGGKPCPMEADGRRHANPVRWSALARGPPGAQQRQQPDPALRNRVGAAADALRRRRSRRLLENAKTPTAGPAAGAVCRAPLPIDLGGSRRKPTSSTWEA